MARSDTQWQPGHSGNPLGRPRRKPVTDALRVELDKAARGGRTKAQRLAARLVTLALGGDVPALKLVLAYVEGLPTQPVELTIREEAERLAQEYGLQPAQIIDLAERMSRRAG
jgi:hypothetical protein